jgi:hypothetical protein
MRWTIPASACLITAALIGCNKNRTNNGAGETGSMTDTAATAAPAPSDTGAMSRSADTGMRGMGTSDTGMRGGAMSDTSHAKSGASKMHPDTSKAPHSDSTAR